MFGSLPKTEKNIPIRRVVAFVILSAEFLGTLTILYLLGISRQIGLPYNQGSLGIPFVVFEGDLL